MRILAVTPLSCTLVTLLVCRPTVGWVKTFWRVGQFFFTKTGVTRKRKVEQLIQRLDMNHLVEDYKRAIDKICGPMAKKGFLGRKPRFWTP